MMGGMGGGALKAGHGRDVRRRWWMGMDGMMKMMGMATCHGRRGKPCGDGDAFGAAWVPRAARIYHVGATGSFLITLNTSHP